MTYTKPCARPTCPDLVVRQTAYDLRRAVYCSRRCAMLVRLSQGYRPPHQPLALRQANGRKGGVIAAQHRRQATRLAVLAQLERSIPAPLRESLTPWQMAAVKALMSLAWQKAQAIERKRWKDQHTRKRKHSSREAA